ncbi:MAG: hypothetical protein KGZ67_05040 [Hydrogenophaga sp.]|jgi:hypothetical protein|nr:hypothetical protein [Hydrogenophaga sp.]
MTQEFKKQKLTKKQLNIPDDRLVHLHDLTFDFEKYFDEYEDLSDEEKAEFPCRVMGLYCKEFYESGGDPSAISPWVAKYIANAMYNVLGGVPWSQALPTPFDDPESQHIWTPKGRRAMDTYCAVTSGKSDGFDVSAMLCKQADRQNVSYETARADYYKAKNAIDNKQNLPDGFLKKTP